MKYSVLLGLAMTLTPVVALATGNVPAQPVTNIKVPTKKDPSDDADPFNIVQLDERLLFFARNKTGYGLYMRSITDPKNPGLSDPVVDLTVKKHLPKRIKQFKKTQIWDPNYRNVVVIDNPNIGQSKLTRPAEGTLFFHVPGLGLYRSKATGGSTKKMLDVDRAPDNSENRWLDFLAGYREQVVDEAKVFFSGEGKKTGVELYVATAGNKPKAKLFADIVPGSGDSFPYLMTTSFKTLYFGAFNPNVQSYQLFKTDGETAPVPVTTTLADFPSEIADDEGGGTYFAVPATTTRAQGGIQDLYFVNSQGTVERYTVGGVDPNEITYFTGTTMFFRGFHIGGGVNTGYEVFTVTESGGAAIKHDINPSGGSNPNKFTRAAGSGQGWMYFTASPDGSEAARRLYRSNSTTLEVILEQNTDVPILMDATSEIMPVMREQGSELLGQWVYFTGTPMGGTEKFLYRVDNDNFNSRAIRVLTPGGLPVRNARNLGKFVAPGIGTYRLYFSCDGAGTEFSDPNATDPRFKPRGFELWCTEVGF